MRAAQYDQYGGPEVLRVRELPVPAMRAGHVLVKVDYSSVNAADVAVRSGSLSIVSGRKFPRGVGFDLAGEVVGVADDVEGFLADDGVWGFLKWPAAWPTGRSRGARAGQRGGTGIAPADDRLARRGGVALYRSRFLRSIIYSSAGQVLVVSRNSLPARPIDDGLGCYPIDRFETGRPGVFAAGDVRSGPVKRVASVVGEGAIAVRQVHDFLATAGRH